MDKPSFPLPDHTELLSSLHTLLRNVRVADKKTARENPKVVAAVEEVAKKLGSDGRILVRESGTEPLIRVMVEAGTDELCLENVDHVVKVMESEGLLID